LTDSVDPPEKPDPNGPGRPPFEPNKSHRRQVSIAAGGGMTYEAIAAALEISVPTLRKYFAQELASGAAKRRLEILSAMFKAAKEGNVSAQKAYIAAGEPNNVAPPPVPQPDKPGKKETADEQAKTAAAGTAWGSILPGHA
jgi:AcrR family transcriptional regulator